jgi:hypothetical protein
VIATGFKNEMPARKERLMMEATQIAERPTRIEVVPVTVMEKPRFASETEEAEAQEAAPLFTQPTMELRPMSASVFDDDFFRSPSGVVEMAAGVEAAAPVVAVVAPGVPAVTPVVDYEYTVPTSTVPEPAAVKFGEMAPIEHDIHAELEIPAYMRRGNA